MFINMDVKSSQGVEGGSVRRLEGFILRMALAIISAVGKLPALLKEWADLRLRE
jgi:hypothetical protein